MGKIRTPGLFYHDNVVLCFPHSELLSVSLLWSLFDPHILRAPRRLLLPPEMTCEHVKDLRGGRPPEDKPGGQET